MKFYDTLKSKTLGSSFFCSNASDIFSPITLNVFCVECKYFRVVF